jgi:hypothetical protein
MKALGFALIILSGSILASAESPISGKWVTKKSQPQVGMEFQTSGTMLTGSVRLADDPPIAIHDGHIEGNRLSFKAMIREGDDEYPLIFSGQRSGNRLKFKCEVETNVPGEKTQLGPACIQSISLTRVK